MLCPMCWGAKVYAGQDCQNCLATGVVADAQLSPHFLLSELLYSENAVRHGVPNVPSDAQLANLVLVATDLLEPIRAQFGPIHVSSGLRVPAVNALVGGSDTSAHVEGNAADINVIVPGVTRKQVMGWLIANKGMLMWDQIIYEGTWVHVARYKNGLSPRGQALMMFGGAYFPYDANDPRVH